MRRRLRAGRVRRGTLRPGTEQEVRGVRIDLLDVRSACIRVDEADRRTVRLLEEDVLSLGARNDDEQDKGRTGGERVAAPAGLRHGGPRGFGESRAGWNAGKLHCEPSPSSCAIRAR